MYGGMVIIIHLLIIVLLRRYFISKTELYDYNVIAFTIVIRNSIIHPHSLHFPSSPTRLAISIARLSSSGKRVSSTGSQWWQIISANFSHGGSHLHPQLIAIDLHSVHLRYLKQPIFFGGMFCLLFGSVVYVCVCVCVCVDDDLILSIMRYSNYENEDVRK